MAKAGNASQWRSDVERRAEAPLNHGRSVIYELGRMGTFINLTFIKLTAVLEFI